MSRLTYSVYAWSGTQFSPCTGHYAAEAAIPQFVRTGGRSGKATLNSYVHVPLYHTSHPMLQFLHQKLAEWITNNYAEELNVQLRPDTTQPWSTATLNRILQTCLVSDRKGHTIHTFQTVELESDLYCGVMRARCYPFNMEHH